MAVGYGQSTYRDAIAFIILVLILLLKPPASWAKGRPRKYEEVALLDRRARASSPGCRRPVEV